MSDWCKSICRENLFDTNVLLDASLALEPFVADVVALLEAFKSGELTGFMSATTVTEPSPF